MEEEIQNQPEPEPGPPQPLQIEPKTPLLEKRKLKRAQSCKGEKDKKQPWTNYYAFLNDVKRDKLMQVPELPQKSLKKKKKRVKKVAKSEFKTKTEETKPTESKDSQSSSSAESENENLDRRTSNTDSDKSTKSASEASNASKNSKTTTSAPPKDTAVTLKRPKFKTTTDLDKINFDNNFNIGNDLNYNIEEALSNLHVSATYKNLLRSMKANV